ncbi:MAG: phosphoribosylglycinamide formyltransferase [Bacteroidetes bacterium GWA2_30_7]|nr:MAG: phosphoribosylglycinamide formyltransferase [Bacteroidetes bacterium GWA2_30_7]
MFKIAIFASGNGTNTQRIIEYFQKSKHISVGLIITNNKNAYVINRAENFNIPCYIFSKNDFFNTNSVIELLKNNNISLIVLAGFLLLIPENLIKNFSSRIINIHPALLPKYGGKGMYGENVHKAVVQNRESETGITIHYVNEKYDEGEIIFQTKCAVFESDTAKDVANKIHLLEYEHFPKVIEDVCKKLLKI